MQQDIHNVETGRMEFSLFVQGSVIFFLYNFGTIGWSDAPFSSHRSKAAVPDGADLMLPLKTVQSQLHLRVALWKPIPASSRLRGRSPSRQIFRPK